MIRKSEHLRSEGKVRRTNLFSLEEDHIVVSNT